MTNTPQKNYKRVNYQCQVLWQTYQRILQKDRLFFTLNNNLRDEYPYPFNPIKTCDMERFSRFASYRDYLKIIDNSLIHEPFH